MAVTKEVHKTISEKAYHDRLDRVFELITIFTALGVFILSAFFYREEVNLFATFLLSFTIIVLSFVFYRVLPSETLVGHFAYSRDDRRLLIAMTTALIIGFLVFISGGLLSPFYFLYLLIIVAAVIILPPLHLLIELSAIIIFIFVTAALHNQTSIPLLLDKIIPVFALSVFTLWVGSAIKLRSDELEEANTRLQKLSELRSDFISLTFNEIKNPLTALRWYLHDTVLVGTKMSPGQKTHFFQTYEHILRIISLVNNLRDLATIDTQVEDEAIKLSQVDLSKLSDDVAKSYRTLVRHKGITFLIQKPRDPVKIYGYSRELISHVLHVLVLNAIFYNHEKGKIILKIEKAKNKVTVSVTDTGLGIKEQEVGSVFDKFYRGEDARFINPSGAGIGLHTAKKVIEERCGGKLWFESEYKKGSTFRFTLSTRRVYLNISNKKG